MKKQVDNGSVRSSLLVLAMITLSAVLPAQQTRADRISTEVDWDARLVVVTVERPISAVTTPGPAAVSRTQRSIRDDAASILLPILADIQFDSRRTVGGVVSETEELIAALERAAQRARPVDASAREDLSAASVTFAVDLYRDLGAQFVTHSRAVPLERRLGWVAHTDYTGIIIHAADALPLFGTDEIVRPEAALFSGIYYLEDDTGLLYRLAEREHYAPEQLETQGAIAYTSDIQATGFSSRIGARPLRILALAAFGERPTDIVISERDALQIMASEANRGLLRSGRVVVVLESGQL